MGVDFTAVGGYGYRLTPEDIEVLEKNYNADEYGVYDTLEALAGDSRKLAILVAGSYYADNATEYLIAARDSSYHIQTYGFSEQNVSNSPSQEGRDRIAEFVYKIFGHKSVLIGQYAGILVS